MYYEFDAENQEQRYILKRAYRKTRNGGFCTFREVERFSVAYLISCEILKFTKRKGVSITEKGRLEYVNSIGV